MTFVGPFNHLAAPTHRIPWSRDQISLTLLVVLFCSIWARTIAIGPSSELLVQHDQQTHHDGDDSGKFPFHDDGQITSQGYDASGFNLDHDYSIAETIASTDDNQTGPVVLSNSNSRAHGGDDHEHDHYHGNDDIDSFEELDREYLTHGLADGACSLDRGCQRKDRLSNTYLNLCTRYKLENLFSNDMLDSIMHDSPRGCKRVLDEFIQLDQLIDQFYVKFKELLTRYNCHNGYSVKWTCEDCKRAYRDWLCATSLPFYMNGERIKPCISFCERVEQRCPYLHPITKEQYGGQPVFICRDPNIPFVPEITPDIPYSEPRKCYDLCHLTRNRTELVIDSLSKYEPDKCPDKNILAEQVRNDYCQLQAPPSSRINITTDGHRNAQETSTIINETEITDPAAGVKQKSPAEVDDVHLRKLNELREVLEVYKSQQNSPYYGHH